ncbi:hypothetical protein P9761_24315 [Brevibacillus centrosporus]|uniref:hypothetical protein n=1 Tax=Brevibacillus centrosporus TaxID=54910 RepID=UPI002E1B1A61|nr:hypothetical protein [Brevibacillus centrosporus]
MKTLQDGNDRKVRSLEAMISLLEEIYDSLINQRLEDAITLYEKVEIEQNLYVALETEMEQAGNADQVPEVKVLLIKMNTINQKIELILSNQQDEITRVQKQNDQMKEASRAYSSYEEGEQESYFFDNKK